MSHQHALQYQLYKTYVPELCVWCHISCKHHPNKPKTQMAGNYNDCCTIVCVNPWFYIKAKSVNSRIQWGHSKPGNNYLSNISQSILVKQTAEHQANFVHAQAWLYSTAMGTHIFVCTPPQIIYSPSLEPSAHTNLYRRPGNVGTVPVSKCMFEAHF